LPLLMPSSDIRFARPVMALARDIILPAMARAAAELLLIILILIPRQ